MDTAERKRNNKLAYARRNKEKFDRIRQKPCMDCGNSFPPCCMDFDHRPGEVKLFTIASSLQKNWSEIDAELKKCDLVCANCHRIRTESRIQRRVLPPATATGGKGHTSYDPDFFPCGHARTAENSKVSSSARKTFKCYTCYLEYQARYNKTRKDTVNGRADSSQPSN